MTRVGKPSHAQATSALRGRGSSHQARLVKRAAGAVRRFKQVQPTRRAGSETFSSARAIQVRFLGRPQVPGVSAHARVPRKIHPGRAAVSPRWMKALENAPKNSHWAVAAAGRSGSGQGPAGPQGRRTCGSLFFHAAPRFEGLARPAAAVSARPRPASGAKGEDALTAESSAEQRPSEAQMACRCEQEGTGSQGGRVPPAKTDSHADRARTNSRPAIHDDRTRSLVRGR